MSGLLEAYSAACSCSSGSAEKRIRLLSDANALFRDAGGEVPERAAVLSLLCRTRILGRASDNTLRWRRSLDAEVVALAVEASAEELGKVAERLNGACACWLLHNFPFSLSSFLLSTAH